MLLRSLLVLALVVKVTIVLSLGDVFFFGEELEKGSAAKGILDGLGVPHHQLAYHYYEGGGFFVSHLKAAAFAVVGENLLAHKLVALFFVLAVLAVGFMFLRRNFGEAAAIWFGLLFVFSPASFQKLSLLSLGIHFEATVFLVLAFLLTGRIVFEKDRRLRNYALLGLVVGFGTYFSYQTGLVAVWCAGLLLLRLPKRTLGLGGLAGLGGTAVGLLPFFLMLYLVGEAVFDVHGTTRAGAPPGSVQLRTFLLAVFRDEALGSRIGPMVWPAATIFAALAVLIDRPDERSDERRRFLFVALFVPFWIAVYLASPFVQGAVPHFFYLLRMAPVWIVALMVIAIALGQHFGARPRSGRFLALAAGGALLAVGAWNTVQVVREGRPGELRAAVDALLHQKGYRYGTYFDKLVPHLEGDDATKLAVLLGFDEPDPEWLAAEALASVLGDTRGDLTPAFARGEALIAASARPELDDAFRIGLGRLLVTGSGWSARAALTQLEGLPAGRERDLYAEGVGRFGSGGHPTVEALLAHLAMAAESPLAEPFARGLGHQLHARHRLHPARAEAFLERAGRLAPSMRVGWEHARELHRL